VEGARQGYRTARTELAGALPPHAVDTVLAAYRQEGARLAATARAVGLVERALRGEVFTPKMGPSTTAGLQAAHPQTAHRPMATQPTADPKAARPKTTGPKAAGPKTTGPKAAQAKAAQMETAQSKAAGPKRADPALAGRPTRQRKAT
jgi:hypothetical protein